MAKIYRREFEELFSEVFIREGFWKTYYSMEGHILLLEQTTTIRSFNRKHDEKALHEIQIKYLTPRGIKTTQHSILIIARK